MANWDQELSKFFGHFSDLPDTSSEPALPDDRIYYIDKDFSQRVGFKRLGVHHVTLPPGCRSSAPHAESAEEEFFFVLKGNPQLWLNGFIHQLQEGHAVGFPAGTGIAHTVINNTDSAIELLVVGERTKDQNLCAFPVNPERRATCGIWWDSPPLHDLGPHRGMPGFFSTEALAKSASPYVVYCPSEPKRQPFHYPGDNETFGTGIRLTDKVALKALGIWFETLPPRTRSSFPHAHSHEEEFVYVIKGQPTLWLDGYTQSMRPGCFAAFPAGTGLPHVIINDTDEEVVFLCVGETAEFPDEKISYPLNELRRRECERKGWYWSETRAMPRGSAKATPSSHKQAQSEPHLAFRALGLSDSKEIDVDTVYSIFKASQTYFKLVDSCEPTLEIARKAITAKPAAQSQSYFKDFLIIERNGTPVGVLDLHVNHPTPGSCYLGLLLIDDSLSRQGLGRAVYKLAEDYIKRAHECKTIVLGVSVANRVDGFWKKMGFKPNNVTYEWRGENLTTTIHEFVKEI